MNSQVAHSPRDPAVPISNFSNLARWLIAATFLAFLLLAHGLLHAAPVINNNTGTFTDAYKDASGVAFVSQTEVDGTSGNVRLVSGQTTGTFTTVSVRPNSFSGWGEFSLDANFSAPGNVQVNPHFPALRSDPMALSGASRRNQIPSSYNGSMLGTHKLNLHPSSITLSNTIHYETKEKQ